jgi:hypothetical protein
MTETKQPNWLPWAIVAGLAYFAFVRQPVQPVDPTPQPVQSVSKILDAAYKADRVSKIAILKEIGTREFASDKAKLDWINSESEKRRIADFQAYVNQVAEAIDKGMTKELAERLEAGK